LDRLNQHNEISRTTHWRIGKTAIALCLFILVSLVQVGTPAYSQDSIPALTPDQEQYRIMAASYVYSRSLDFKDEMMSREWYLLNMVEGINKELKARRKEGMLVAPAELIPPEIEKPTLKKYKLPLGLEKEPSAGAKYIAWETPLREDYDQKYLQARIIKDKLLGTATPSQLKRMFEYDVRAGLDHYADKEYRQSLLFLDEAVDRYPYADITDVLQYRAEAFIGMKLYDEAVRDFRIVMQISVDKTVRRETIEKLIILLGEKGEIDEIRVLWEEYTQIVGKENKLYWNTAFNVASYLFVNNIHDEAKALFDSFPEKHPRYAEARLRAADCSLRQLNLEEADQRYFILVKKRLKGKGITPYIIGEARLKLGYIDFLRGDYDLAFINFNQADQSDQIDEQSTMAAAWALYQLKAYPQAVKLAKEVLKNYPNSPRQYEAQCLIGFSSEKMKMGSSALDNYTSIMTAMDNRQDFRELNYEKREAELIIKQVRALEESIFLYGREDLFVSYKAMRKNALILMERINIAETVKNNPILLVIMEEQREVMRVMEEYAAVNADEADYWNSFTYTFDKNVYRMLDAFTGLERAKNFYYNKKTLVQQEEKRIFDAEIHDSLRARVTSEFAVVQDKLRAIRSQVKAERGSSGAEETGVVSNEYDNIIRRDSLIHSRLAVPDDKDVPPDSKIEDWSDFAYERYTYGGLDFDDMFIKQDKVKKIDHYIRNIDIILAGRRPVVIDTSTFPDNLFPRVVEGDTTYAAPAFPMWDPIKSPIVGPLINKRVDESFTKPDSSLPEGVGGNIDTTGASSQPTDVPTAPTDGSVTPSDDGSSSTDDAAIPLTPSRQGEQPEPIETPAQPVVEPTVAPEPEAVPVVEPVPAQPGSESTDDQ